MRKQLPEKPLISVIIPCYNQGCYLQDAFESIYSQNYPNVEIVVVDDGSTDNTKEVTRENANVKYFYQSNRGPSAARNIGIKNSSGDLLIFLDADDWLLPDAINTNLFFLKAHPELAFVSGGYRLVFTGSSTITTEDSAYEINEDHYINFLKKNYIGMHAAVTYQRWVFSEFAFSETLRVCEDYDLYLNISRKYPVYHHTGIVSAYRIHNFNVSLNIPKMLIGVLKVLEIQKKMLATPAEKKAYALGRNDWKKYYCKELYKKLNNSQSASYPELLILVKYAPFLATNYLLRRLHNRARNYF